MKKLFYTFVAFLFIVSACKKDDNIDFAKKLVIGNWNNVDLRTKVPTGKYLKLNDGGSMESTIITGYNSYEISNNQLVFKGSNGTQFNTFVVSSDSLYLEPNTPCADINGCGTLYARQK